MAEEKNVIIYSTPYCMYCQVAKDWFKQKGIVYTEYDVSVDTKKREEMMQKTGSIAVPVIEIDKEIIIGFDKNKMSQLLGI